MNMLRKGISGYELKVIGAILMLCDHVHQMFYYAGAPMFLTMLGRLVLPIFLFMSAEGFHYTRDKKKYMIRLLVSFWLMNIATIIISRMLPMDNVVLMNNIFGTMFLATLGMYAVDCLKEKKWIKGIVIFLLPVLPFILMTLLTDLFPVASVYLMFIFPSYFTVEAGFIGVFLGIALYIFRGNRVFQYTAIIVVSVISTGFDFQSLFSVNIQWMMVFSILLIALYNGVRGKGSKYFFYVFYPAHIYLLYVLSYLYSNHIL